MNEMTMASDRSADLLKVLVVDDHTLLNETLSARFEASDAIEVETVTNVDDAHRRISESGRFDTVLLDYDVPGMDGLSGLHRLIEANGGSVALFSGVAKRQVVERAIEAGASGFIPKTMPFKTLGHAIRIIAGGDVYLPSDFLLRKSRQEEGSMGLKPRELRVLSLLCEGMQNKEIGREIGVDEASVKMYVRSVCQKLGARNRTQAVIAAMKQGFF